MEGESVKQLIRVWGLESHSTLDKRVWSAVLRHTASRGAEYRRRQATVISTPAAYLLTFTYATESPTASTLSSKGPGASPSRFPPPSPRWSKRRSASSRTRI